MSTPITIKEKAEAFCSRCGEHYEVTEMPLDGDDKVYSTTASAARHDGNHANRSTEVLWFSPHCLSGQMPTLFGARP